MNQLHFYTGAKILTKIVIALSEFFHHISRLNYFVVTTIILVGQFSLVWSLAEFSCVLCGLGVYPDSWEPRSAQGPTIPYRYHATI